MGGWLVTYKNVVYPSQIGVWRALFSAAWSNVMAPADSDFKVFFVKIKCML